MGFVRKRCAMNLTMSCLINIRTEFCVACPDFNSSARAQEGETEAYLQAIRISALEGSG